MRDSVALTVAVAVNKSAKQSDRAHELELLCALSDFTQKLALSRLEYEEAVKINLKTERMADLPAEAQNLQTSMKVLSQSLHTLGVSLAELKEKVTQHLGTTMEELSNKIKDSAN